MSTFEKIYLQEDICIYPQSNIIAKRFRIMNGMTMTNRRLNSLVLLLIDKKITFIFFKINWLSFSENLKTSKQG